MVEFLWYFSSLLNLYVSHPKALKADKMWISTKKSFLPKYSLGLMIEESQLSALGIDTTSTLLHNTTMADMWITLADFSFFMSLCKTVSGLHPTTLQKPWAPIALKYFEPLYSRIPQKTPFCHHTVEAHYSRFHLYRCRGTTLPPPSMQYSVSATDLWLIGHKKKIVPVHNHFGSAPIGPL